MRIAKLKDCLFGIVLLLASVFFFYETYNFRKVAYFSIGPTVFPRIILGGLMLLSCCLIFQSLHFGGAGAPLKSQGDSHEKRTLINQAAFICLMLGYVALLNVIGYVAASTLFMFLGMLLLGRRTLARAGLYLVVSLGIALLMRFCFQNMLHLFLP